MEVVNLKHSTKDVPMPNRKLYSTMMINSLEKFTQNLRWKVLFFLKPSNKSSKNNYGFKSTKIPPPIPQLEAFEDDLINMVENIEFKNISNKFQEQLKTEQEAIKNEPKLLVAADKTSNFYKVDYEQYENLLEKEVNKEYKKVKEPTVKKVNNAHKKIVNDLGISDRVFKTVKRESFITLKDHKPNFKNSPSCRLLNPTKPEVGKVSHQILKKIVECVRNKTQLKQWKNVYSCIEWFKLLKNKKNLSFIIFDIVSFYPSISLELLEEAIEWAKQFVDVTDEERKIILESRKTLLAMKNSFWTKKQNPDFDVSMGSFDSAEICDLVGLFLLSKLEDLKVNAQFGLYKDDGLAASEASPRQVEAIKKKICKTFKAHGLNITIEANKKVVQFLDVELNLSDDTFKPFIKPNDIPVYVNKDSNHPSSITKNIPEAINRRLSSLSSNEEMFQSVAQTYQDALKNAGYEFKLQFKPNQLNNMKPRARKRQIVWFNPPWAMNVKTNVGGQFLKLVDKHFPKSNPLSKIVNRNTVKISYRTTPNIKKVISSHNAKILRNAEKQEERSCSCRNKDKCPLDGKCLTKNLIYQATVVTTQPTPETQTYIGLSAPEFKARLGNHKKSFNHEKHKNDTTLSQFIWKLKKKNVEYEIHWKLIDRAETFNPVTGLCNLCTLEKFYLIFKPELGTLNKNNEFNSYCLHKAQQLLDKT